ncbi:MAG: type II secretion system protein [Alphaproteobacteria bacterium]|nr:type II secretion system protein [Alphaproteobacteria bacterium]
MNQESGRSMIEMLGVLAIMGVLTVGAVGMISTAMRTQKLTEVNDEVIQMVTMVRNIHGEYDDFSTMNGQTIFGAIGMSRQNPYGGNYELAVNPSDPRQFVVTINGLGQSECESLVAKAWSDSVGYQLSNGKQGGATGSCNGQNGTNYVQIIYGE